MRLGMQSWGIGACVSAPPPGGDHAVAASVARNPAQHGCVIEHSDSDSDSVADASPRSGSLVGKGPAVPIVFSATQGWSFDPISSPLGSLVVPVSFQAGSGPSET